MIIALWVCVGVSIMVSWGKSHHLFGKWWFWMAAWRQPAQSVSSFQNAQWCGSVEMNASNFHHTLMFVFLASEEHQYLTQRETFFFLAKGEDVSPNSALMLKCPILELCTQVFLRSWGGDASHSFEADVQTSCMRSSLWLSLIATLVGTVYVQSGGRSRENFPSLSVSLCVILSPTSFMLHLKWEPSWAK